MPGKYGFWWSPIGQDPADHFTSKALDLLLGFDRVNTFIEFWEDPCRAPWTVYAKTALPALGNAAMTLVGTSTDDVVRAYTKPNAARQRSKRGGRLLRRVSRLRIPETGELIAKRIPGQQTLARRSVSTGVKHLWVIDGAVQKGLWWWMVGDVALEFGHQWLTGIMESQECQTGLLGAACVTDSGGTYTRLNEWDTARGDTIEKEWGQVFTSGDHAYSVQEAPFIVTAGVSFQPLGPG